jgi:hypothetical protein
MGALCSGVMLRRRRYLAAQSGHQRALLAVQLAYAVLFTGYLFYSHTWPAPDVVALFLLVFALVAARGLHFLRDWTPFVVLLLGYIALSGVSSGLIATVHIGFPINADRWLFHGTVPTLWLQEHFYSPGHARWYDYVASLLYPMHFVVPLLLAFALWMWRRAAYWRFISSYLLLCYTGFLTYLLYPMAPPWWAYRYHRLPPVHLILYEVHYGGASNPIVLATQLFKPNPVAAMPSLHAAFPVLVWLVLWRTWPRWGWIAVVYPLAMAAAVVYLGEHYIVDCPAGWLYALASFGAVWGSPALCRLWRRETAPPAILRAIEPVAPALIPVRSRER